MVVLGLVLVAFVRLLHFAFWTVSLHDCYGSSHMGLIVVRAGTKEDERAYGYASKFMKFSLWE